MRSDAEYKTLEKRYRLLILTMRSIYEVADDEKEVIARLEQGEDIIVGDFDD